jgi:hypothetical protein
MESTELFFLVDHHVRANVRILDVARELSERGVPATGESRPRDGA